MPPEYVRSARSAASASSNTLEQPRPRGRFAALRHAAEPADQHEVLPPGEIVVDRRVLTGEPDHGPHELGLASRRRGRPTVAGPPSGRSSVVRIRMVVVLPARWAEQADDGAFRDLEVDAIERGEVAEALDQALGDHAPATAPPADRSGTNTEPNT